MAQTEPAVGAPLERRVGPHTPGPWLWEDDYRGLYGAGKNHEILCHASYEGMWLTHGPAREANALLLAAAPDLLAALNAMLTHMGMDEDEWNRPTFEQARRAVAKAVFVRPNV